MAGEHHAPVPSTPGNSDTPSQPATIMSVSASASTSEAKAESATASQPVLSEPGQRSAGGLRGGNNREASGESKARNNPKKRNLGRAEWSRHPEARRDRVERHKAKRQRIDNGEESLPAYATEFSKEDIEKEERKPKKKVAVFVGYSGSGYKGMQIDPLHKTIEGDLFKAFVEAGAISKANADDPKKSSLVRCARTDKGVHAAGNIISLKLIQGDPDVVSKINDRLTPQIRVWGIQRVNNAFSCYQLCDSRVYEYLIPTHAFLPPHPSSFLGKKLDELAEEVGDVEGYKERQKEVGNFWEETDRTVIEPLIKNYDDDIRDLIRKALWNEKGDDNDSTDNVTSSELITKDEEASQETSNPETEAEVERSRATTSSSADIDPTRIQTIKKVAEAVKSIRVSYLKARQTYRISPERLARVCDTFNLYVGTKRFHNYTIQKKFRDPSAQRQVKSFHVNTTPIIIDGTEWLSIKVHGQSFMMHQIRKMVGFAALIVRCGTDPELIPESFKDVKMAIPKAPGLGLLLERPIFDSFNQRAAKTLPDVEPIEFTKWEKEMDEFKQREIYERIFREEEEQHAFSNFFNHVDSYTEPTFLYVTSKGIAATQGAPSASSVKAKSGGGPVLPDDFDSEPEEELVGAEGDG